MYYFIHQLKNRILTVVWLKVSCRVRERSSQKPQALNKQTNRSQSTVWNIILRVLGLGSHSYFQYSTGYWHCSWLPTRTKWQDLLLTKQHTLDIGHGGMELELSQKPSPCHVAFMVLGSAMWAPGGEKSSTVLPGCGQVPRYVAPTHLWSKSGMTILWVTSCFLVEFEACSTEKYSCLVL